MAKKQSKDNSIDNEAVPDEELRGNEENKKGESSGEGKITVNDALEEIDERLRILEYKTGLRTY